MSRPLQQRAEPAERLSLAAMATVQTLGARSGQHFDLRARAGSIDVDRLHDREGRLALADTLHRIVGSLG